MAGLIANKTRNNGSAPATVQKQSVAAIFNSLLDSEGISNRVKELMGKRAPQFTASLVSMVNASAQMQEVFQKNPISIIQSALKAASYDLPCDQALGYAYIVPFGGQAQFILG